MSIFRDQLQLSWDIKDPIPRTNERFAQQLDQVVAEAVIGSGGQKF